MAGALQSHIFTVCFLESKPPGSFSGGHPAATEAALLCPLLEQLSPKVYVALGSSADANRIALFGIVFFWANVLFVDFSY